MSKPALAEHIEKLEARIVELESKIQKQALERMVEIAQLTGQYDQSAQPLPAPPVKDKQ